jgi:hypothetical protein
MNTNEEWHTERAKLQDAVREAVLNLFYHSGTAAFLLEAKHPLKTEMFIVCGSIPTIEELLKQKKESQSP